MNAKVFVVSLVLSTSVAWPVYSAPLKGGVQEEDFRLTAPAVKTDDTRIARAPAMAPEDVDALKGLVDTNDFSPQNFDLGADRNSREMVLAWERWHHQLTKAIYTRWRAVNRTHGHALMRITVTRDLHITAQTLKN